MPFLAAIDWSNIFVPSVSVFEIIIRGSLVYLALFLLFRVFLKRDAGSVGLADLLLVVLIADASQNAMSADYKSVTDGVVLISTLAFWNYFLDWLAWRSPKIRAWISPPPLRLIKDGRMLRHNLRKEMLSKDELLGHLREEGINSLADVKEAYIESDGKISVVKRES